MSVYLNDPDVTLYHGDALQVLRELPDGSVDCVVTSPPYWGLRDYGNQGQLGLEPTPDLFVHNMVEVFREVRRVLADHGTCWVNLGDSYANDTKWGGSTGGKHVEALHGAAGGLGREKRTTGLKPKDLVGIPWRVAFALQADGWYLRSDIIWSKPNPMPESVTDRPTKAHEYVFLLTKRPRYFFDAEAVREPHTSTRWGGETITQPPTTKYAEATADGFNGAAEALSRPGREWNAYPNGGRNVRSVWQIATQPYPEAHFATFPEELARRCIVAGCPVRVCRVCGKPSERIVADVAVEPDPTQRTTDHYDTAERYGAGNGGNSGLDDLAARMRAGIGKGTIGWSDCGHNNWRPGVTLDPFIGSGTVAKVARDHQRHAIGIDLNETYLELAARRLQQLSLLAET